MLKPTIHPAILLTLWHAPGLDLQGNTFWEFRDTLSSHQHRMRRIAQYPPSTHYSEINISPQWHQWLRHTRSDPPSLTEQSQDLVRQENLKVLAARADARWASKPSFLDAPGQAQGQPLPTLEAAGLRSQMDATTPGKDGQESNTKGGSAEPLQNTEEPIKMQVPDGIRHHFVERPKEHTSGTVKETKETKEMKEKEDPWKQARGGPSEQWQPASWTGNAAPARRG